MYMYHLEKKNKGSTDIGNRHRMYVELIKKYRVECKSYSSKLEFALSSVSVIRFHKNL